MKNWIIRIVGGLAFYFVSGFLILGLWLGSAVLGYQGEIAADMAASAFPLFMLLWVVCLPFFILIGALIEGIGLMTGLLQEKHDLR